MDSRGMLTAEPLLGRVLPVNKVTGSQNDPPTTLSPLCSKDLHANVEGITLPCRSRGKERDIFADWPVDRFRDLPNEESASLLMGEDDESSLPRGFSIRFGHRLQYFRNQYN
jgi:hypothetical protein